MNNIVDTLENIQQTIFQKAESFINEHTMKIDDKKTFYAFFTPKNKEQPEIHGGFALSGWCGSQECEEAIKSDLKVTIRCLPLNADNEKIECIYCKKPAEKRVIFAKSY